MTFDTLNPVPSTDPRDLYDNSTHFDEAINGVSLTFVDRTGATRKSIAGMEADVAAFSSPNVIALAALAGGANLGFYFTGSGAMSTYTLSSLGRTLGGIANSAAGRTALGLGAASTFDTVPVANGGTGAVDATNARTNLGLGTVAVLNTVPLTQGGTGSTTAAAARTALGLGTAAIATVGTSGNNLGLLNTANTWSAAQAILGVTPVTDGGSNCGTGALRWATVFAQTGTINTSDAREKTPVRGLSSVELKASAELARAIGAYKWLASVEEKGHDAREHIGMTVQRAIEIMAESGLEPMAYGFICYDEWEGGDRYGFRMDELNAFIAAGFSQRLAILEEKMTND